MESRAPLVVSIEVTVDASAHTVWKVLSDIEAWPQWVPGVREASLEGALLIGGGFALRRGAARRRCVLRAVERPRRLAWTEATIWTQAAQSWDLIALDRGCRIAAQRSVEGLGLRWARWRGRLLPESERIQLEGWMQALQRRVRQEVPCG